MIWLLRHAMCDMMPSAAGLPALADAGVDTFLAQLRRETSGLVWLGLVAGAALYVVTPVFTLGVPLPSMWLSAQQRDRHAERITSTDVYLLRQAVFLVKMYACMCWGQDADVRRGLSVLPYPQGADPGTFRVS